MFRMPILVAALCLAACDPTAGPSLSARSFDALAQSSTSQDITLEFMEAMEQGPFDALGPVDVDDAAPGTGP
jgi:hypothetical protein